MDTRLRSILLRRLAEIAGDLTAAIDGLHRAPQPEDAHERIKAALRQAGYFQAVIEDLEHDD